MDLIWMGFLLFLGQAFEEVRNYIVQSCTATRTNHGICNNAGAINTNTAHTQETYQFMYMYQEEKHLTNALPKAVKPSDIVESIYIRT